MAESHQQSLQERVARPTTLDQGLLELGVDGQEEGGFVGRRATGAVRTAAIQLLPA